MSIGEKIVGILFIWRTPFRVLVCLGKALAGAASHRVCTCKTRDFRRTHCNSFHLADTSHILCTMGAVCTSFGTQFACALLESLKLRGRLDAFSGFSHILSTRRSRSIVAAAHRAIRPPRCVCQSSFLFLFPLSHYSLPLSRTR